MAGTDTPLFNTLTVFNPIEINHAVFGAQPASHHRSIHLFSPTHYDLVFSAHRKPELAIQIAAFDGAGEDSARLLACLRCLLEQVAAWPDIRISDLEHVTAEERERVTVEWNRTEAGYPRDKLLHGLFEEQVLRTPEAVAVAFSGEYATYRELGTQGRGKDVRGLGGGDDSGLRCHHGRGVAGLVVCFRPGSQFLHLRRSNSGAVSLWPWPRKPVATAIPHSICGRPPCCGIWLWPEPTAAYANSWHA